MSRFIYDKKALIEALERVGIKYTDPSTEKKEVSTNRETTSKTKIKKQKQVMKKDK